MNLKGGIRALRFLRRNILLGHRNSSNVFQGAFFFLFWDILFDRAQPRDVRSEMEAELTIAITGATTHALLTAMGERLWDRTHRAWLHICKNKKKEQYLMFTQRKESCLTTLVPSSRASNDVLDSRYYNRQFGVKD